MLVGLGGMILVLFTASLLIAQIRSLTNSTLPSMRHVFSIFELCFAVIANGTLFSFVYRWLPKKEVYWIDAIRGGLLAAFIWELGREVLGVFFIGMRYTSAYGAIGSFIAILLWCYYGISILFFGAEYVQVLQLRRLGRSTTGAELSLNKSAKFVELPIVEPQIDATDKLSNASNDEMIESGLREVHAPLLSQPKQRPRRSAEQLY
jgi:membrane protein